MKRNIVLAFVLAALLDGCAHNRDPFALGYGPNGGYRGLDNQPPVLPADCWILGRDDLWRPCPV